MTPSRWNSTAKMAHGLGRGPNEETGDRSDGGSFSPRSFVGRTLMSHILMSGAITLLTAGVIASPEWTPLVPVRGPSGRLPAADSGAFHGAIDVSPVTRRADPDLPSAPGAQKESVRHRNRGLPPSHQAGQDPRFRGYSSPLHCSSESSR